MTKTPDTIIPCQVCLGTKKHPKYEVPCSACFGSGLSTAPYHQRRNATTVTWTEENLAQNRIGLPGLEVHTKTPCRTVPGAFVMLISWPNCNYDQYVSELCTVK